MWLEALVLCIEEKRGKEHVCKSNRREIRSERAHGEGKAAQKVGGTALLGILKGRAGVHDDRDGRGGAKVFERDDLDAVREGARLDNRRKGLLGVALEIRLGHIEGRIKGSRRQAPRLYEGKKKVGKRHDEH